MQEDTRVRAIRGEHAGRVGTIISASDELTSWVHFDGDALHRQWRIAHEDLTPLPTTLALEQLVAAAKAAGADAAWLLRGAGAVAIEWSFIPDGTSFEHSMLLAPPHELIILIRIPTGDGGERGVEVRS